MRRLLKGVSILAGVVAMFVGYRLLVLTNDGEMAWFVLDGRARLIEDGKPVDGWLHREWRDRVFLITLNSDSDERRSYLVIPVTRRGPLVEGCDGWTAARLPITPFPVLVSDALPCPGWRLPVHPPLFGEAMLSSTSLEFVNERGRRLQVVWK